MLLYFFSFMLALFLGLYITPIVQEAAFKYDIVDYPDGQLKKHGKPVAYLGGIALYLAFLFALALSFEFSREVLGLLLSGTIVILLGIIDDLKFLSPGLKLTGQAIAVFVLVKSGIYIQVTFLPYAVCLVLTFFWLMTTINAFNIIDVMDGLSSTVGFVIAVVLFAVSVINGRPMIAVLTASLAGALLGFVRYNFEPAKIYLGDAGSMFIGLMVGALAMIGSYTEHNTPACVTPLVLLGVPIFDTCFVVYVRWRRGVPVIYGSPDHFALRLRKWRLSTRQTVLLSGAVSLTLGLLGIAMMLSRSSYLTLGIVAVILAAGVLVGYFLKKVDMGL